MPTILLIHGWRLFFYANERGHPPHIHASKGNSRCKFWLYSETFDIELAHEYDITRADHRTVRRIVFENFDYILQKYLELHGGAE